MIGIFYFVPQFWYLLYLILRPRRFVKHFSSVTSESIIDGSFRVIIGRVNFESAFEAMENCRLFLSSP